MPNIIIPNAEVSLLEETPQNPGRKISPNWYRELVKWRDRINSVTIGGNLTATATSDTNLRFSYRGSDGVTRTADITLS